MLTQFSIPFFFPLPPAFSLSLPPSSQVTALTIKFKFSLPGAPSKTGMGWTKVAETAPREKMTEGKILGESKTNKSQETQKSASTSSLATESPAAWPTCTFHLEGSPSPNALTSPSVCPPLHTSLLPTPLPLSVQGAATCALEYIVILDSQPIPSLASFTPQGPRHVQKVYE